MARSAKTSPDSALRLLGLAARAGVVVPGTQQVRAAVRIGRVRFALVANDLTPTGLDKLVPMLEARGVPFAVRYTRAELGAAVGRPPLAGIALTDAGFAGRIQALLGGSGGAV